MAVHSDSMAAVLTKALGLPKHCRKAELILEVNEVALVRCEFYPEISRDILELKTYMLVEIVDYDKWEVWRCPYLDAERGW